MKSVYVRFYDQENLGDDLFLQMLTDRYVNDIAIRKSHRSGAFLPTRALSVIRENYAVSFIDRALSRVFKSRLLLSMSTIRQHDILVHVGGSLFMETDGTAFWEREERFYKQIKIPYYILGSNVGPVQSKEFMHILRGIFSKAADVCFRDSASYDLFRDVPTARLATDIVFALNPMNYVPTRPVRKNALISVIDGGRKFDESFTTAYDAQIIDLSKKLIDQGYDVTLMSFCKDEGDEIAIRRILSSADDTTRELISTHFYRGDLQSALHQVAKSDVIVASRFHAAILGLVFNKKVLPMAYSDKTTNILSDIGFEGPIIDIRKLEEFDSSSFDAEKLTTHNIDNQRILAEKQFEVLDKVLEKRK